MASIVISCSAAVPRFRFNKSPIAASVVTARPRCVVVVRAESQGNRRTERNDWMRKDVALRACFVL